MTERFNWKLAHKEALTIAALAAVIVLVCFI